MVELDPVQPFAGLVVVEFGQFISVPFCGQLLADGGAHVIKVEPVTGDAVRTIAPVVPGESRHFMSRNRGKHSLPLELKHPSAARIIDALVARADVVLTNFRPGLAAEMGLDHVTLAARYPRLIVGNVTGFGLDGPDAGLAAMDLVMQARSGLMAAGGRVQDGLPQGSDAAIADYMCAMTLAFGIASALVRRAATGRGGQVDVSLFMAALTAQNSAMVRVHAVDGPAHAEMLKRLAELRERGAPWDEQLAFTAQVRTPAMTHVYYRTYATHDTAIVVACVSPGMQRALMQAMGLVDEKHGRRFEDPAAEARHYAALGQRAESIAASRTTAEWKAIFDTHGIPAAAVMLPLEMLDDRQALANGMLHDLDHPTLGKVRVLGTPVKMDGAGFRPAPAAAPLGSEARPILQSLGFTDTEVDALVSEGVTRDRPLA